MKCNFQKAGENLYQCEFCGLKIKSKTGKIHSECPKRPSGTIAVDDTPSLIQRAINFSPAIIKHGMDGFAEVSEEEASKRLDICRACPLFIKYNENSGICGHEKCGCNLSSEKKFLNKIRWRSEKCPINKW